MDTLDIPCYPSLGQDTTEYEKLFYTTSYYDLGYGIYYKHTAPTVLRILFLPPKEHHLLTGVTDPTIMY